MGLIHIYCGDGKGKTTASMGLCGGCRHESAHCSAFKGQQDCGA